MVDKWWILEDAEFSGARNGLPACADVELAIDVERVGLDGGRRHDQFFRDLLVGHVSVKQFQDLEFARRQGFDQRRRTKDDGDSSVVRRSSSVVS
jgi:hypothetical protein